MTDAEFDQLMQHNSDARIVAQDGTLQDLSQYKAQQTREIAGLLGLTPRQLGVPEPSEEEMQAAVIAWADAQVHPALRWLFHVPNGGARDPATGGKLKAQGVRPGVPDLWLPWRTGAYSGLVIEMKRKPNRPSDEQKDWIYHLMDHGWRVEVCYSAAAAIDVLREYLDIA